MKRDPSFDFGTHVKSEVFANREADQRRLEMNFLSGINTVIISPRRWGKSSLLAQMQVRMKRKHRDVRFCFIDMTAIRTESEFYQVFAREVIKSAGSKWEEWLKVTRQFFRAIVPKISLSTDPKHEFELGINFQEVQKNPEEILDLPEKLAVSKKIRLVVCLDEFQNIAHFDTDISFQKILRAHWQKHQEACYCIYGSKRHMMADMFEKTSMPFYKFGYTMFLEKIEEKHWVPFIQGRFNKTGKNISAKTAALIAQLMENHPYFVQQLALESWSRCKRTCNDTDVRDALDTLMVRHTIYFQRETDNLSVVQLNLLKAICSGAQQLTSIQTMRDFNLGSSGSVKRAKEGLENKDIIDTMTGKIEVLDPLFKHWYKTYFMSGRMPT